MGARPRWRIYYGDGATFDDSIGPPEDAPGYNVQFIVYRQPNGQPARLAGKDFYWWADGGWVAGDRTGLEYQLFGKSGWQKALAGASIPSECFQAIKDACVNDPHFQPPPQSDKG